jgi:hypothetical protein
MGMSLRQHIFCINKAGMCFHKFCIFCLEKLIRNVVRYYSLCFGGGLIGFSGLGRYRKGWGLDTVDNRLYLTWKEQMVICSTAWKLVTDPSP